MKRIPLLLLVLALLAACNNVPDYEISGEAMTWHTLTLSFRGPESSEEALPNPFLDYRLEVTFSNGTDSIRIPGFYAADGNASESSASSGNIWQVRFAPPAEGEWTFKTSFRQGRNLAVSEDPLAGEALAFDGLSGSFNVLPSDKEGRDFRARGRLEYVGERYLRFAGTEEYFLKGGAGSPENFLGYFEFDGTHYGGTHVIRDGEDDPNVRLHRYEAHVPDWEEGDPLWQGEKGKGIIGALNYLASKGMNSVYMLSMNVQGDGDDVWPWSRREERYRFDCSKLDQWELVFSHMDELGLMIHLLLQETENENLLDVGRLDVQRKLYLRELVARFGHHLAITWNIGEENGPDHWTPVGQTLNDRKAMISYLKKIIPYNSFIVVHTHAADPVHSKLIEPLLGYADLDGPSLQLHHPRIANEFTLRWIEGSAAAGKQWVVPFDEQGPHWMGLMPDADDPQHDTIRNEALWGHLMAGGAGVEWYFGYKYAHADLNCEDWRSRDLMWDQTRYALEFFREHLPFWEMNSRNDLVSEGYGFARADDIYAVYLPRGKGSIDLRETDASYSIHWFNPRTGGALIDGEIKSIEGGTRINPGPAPDASGKDWLVLLRKMN